MRNLIWKNWVVMIAGAIIVALPAAGFPNSLDRKIVWICGALIFLAGIFIGRDIAKRGID